MPAKSKAQQRFMGMVHAYKKGELKGSEVSKDVKDAAKGMKKKDTKKYASTKHKGLPNKVKKEELKRLIAKYGAKRVRETVMAVRPKAVTVSGNRMPEDPDFEYDPEKVTDEGFGGELKGKDKDKFEKARIENAEQLGYKATGTSDTKKQKLKMAHELKEVSNPTSGIMMARKMSSLEMQQIILLAKAMKQLPGSPAQKKIKKQINVIRKKLGQAPVKESVNEGKKAVKAYKEMNSAVTTAIYGVKNFRKLIDDAPYVPVLTTISQELYRFEIDLEKKLRLLLPQMKKYSTGNKFMESVNEAPISSPSQLPYSSPEAQKMAEKDIIGMSKILGKASQMSIKKMMDGVKAKKYDAFDLQRAIMSGPIRDTHTGERDFMRVLWNKVRSGFRRYSKRGKLR